MTGKKKGINHARADFKKIKTYPINERGNKVNVSDFADLEKYKKTKDIVSLLPFILKAAELKEIAAAMRNAVKNKKGVIFALGAHVIKTGCSPIIIDWIKNGVITGVALNGAGAVHDLEIAMIGATSEDVEEEVKTGRFGMVSETAEHTYSALLNYDEMGFGQAVGEWILEEGMEYADKSILAACAGAGVPATVHASIGCEIIHTHPLADGALIGEKSMEDFKIFTATLKSLSGGGCYFNVGSAVVLPEVFIKALSAARNLGGDVKDFTTVDFDMIRHYRPSVNVVHRPVTTGGKGYQITGHHELLLPLLYHLYDKGN